jgi:hypothetical protein
MALTIESILSYIISAGSVGYVIHLIVQDYKDMKTKIDKKINRDDCNEFRRLEELRMKSVEDNLKENWEDHHD